MSPSDLNALIDRRSDPSARAVLDDYHMERGERVTRLGWVLTIYTAAAVAAADDTDDDAAADAAAAAADAAAAAAAADAAIKSLHQQLKEDPDMRNGLKIIAFLPGRYGYGLTRVGWVRRISGDEFEILGGRTIWRKSGQFQMGGLNKLAADGLGKDYEATDPDAMPEELHRLLVRRSLPANEEKRAKLCPRPKGWVEQ
jgi:hypothetical protein